MKFKVGGNTWGTDRSQGCNFLTECQVSANCPPTHGADSGGLESKGTSVVEKHPNATEMLVSGELFEEDGRGGNFSSGTSLLP